MWSGVIVGTVVTVVAMVVFLAWTYRELRRVDAFTGEDGDEPTSGTS